ncbi:MAG: hypothetical protein CBC48_15105 [bacterium TMED88]|nr:glutathione S-transferase [Deltaproteobacteria bacterium]OUV26690.1 MAG: hypothetical protein CBC48_15105 [bacterium TMED88]
MTSVGRLGNGHDVDSLGARPQKPLILYEYEACPFCRKVREALTRLDLSVEVRPCPRGGRRFREEAIRRGGRAQFPYLVDPNAGISLYESEAIVQHLFDHYGDQKVTGLLSLGGLGDLNSALAGLPRILAGRTARPSRTPSVALELYSMESSPFCRLVRERLCELEIPYRLHNVGQGSPSRDEFLKRSGKMMVPWLYDPNSEVGLFESAEIVDYLETTYGENEDLAERDEAHLSSEQDAPR